MRVGITGADGFLGWHLRCALDSNSGHTAVAIGRHVMADPDLLGGVLSECDAVVHLAGVNRGTDEDVEGGNIWLADTLSRAVKEVGVGSLVYANSIHSGTDSSFGRSKARAAETLGAAAASVGATFTDVLLPNIFGEGGRPHYNSVVATFCHQLVSGEQPRILADRELPLLHAQDACDHLVDLLSATSNGQVSPEGHPTTVSAVLTILEEMRIYPRTGDFPVLSTSFRVALFNTFLSFCFPAAFPIDRQVHRDARGSLFEMARAKATDTLSFVSSTRPGAVRGQHYHRRKVERFLVVEGEAEIKLRRVCGDDEVSFRVSGDRPQAVDMPTLWAHSIRNVGERPLITAFWTNELLDAENPDTHPYDVYQLEQSA